MFKILILIISLSIFAFRLIRGTKKTNAAEKLFDTIPDTIRFINATCALNLTLNGLSWYVYGGTNSTTPEDIPKIKSMLNDAWGITKGEDLISQINSLFVMGHNAAYRHTFESILDSNFHEDPSKEEAIVQLCKEINYKHGSNEILAWDLCRIVMLASLGYRVGYISYNDSTSYALKASRLIQEKFSSWKDLMDNHLLGYKFGALLNFEYTEVLDLEKILSKTYKTLTKDNYILVNPYLVPWNTLLTEIDIINYEATNFAK